MFAHVFKTVGEALVKGFAVAQHLPAVRSAERTAAKAAAAAVVAHLPEDKRASARELAAALVEHLDELASSAGDNGKIGGA